MITPVGSAKNRQQRPFAFELRGRGCAAGAISEGISARTLLIAFSSDWLYPPEGSQELADALRANGRDVQFHVIEAPYGHDCFLLEEARQTPMIQDFLNGRIA